MRKSISTIVQNLSKTSTAIAFGVTLVGGAAAHADSRVEVLMNQGMDYVAARDAAARADVRYAPPELVARAKKVAEELRQGEDYVAANEASASAAPVFSWRLADAAKRTEAALNSGKDYVAARDAADKAVPTVARPGHVAGIARAAK